MDAWGYQDLILTGADKGWRIAGIANQSWHFPKEWYLDILELGGALVVASSGLLFTNEKWPSKVKEFVWDNTASWWPSWDQNSEFPTFSLRSHVLRLFNKEWVNKCMKKTNNHVKWYRGRVKWKTKPQILTNNAQSRQKWTDEESKKP